MSPVIDQGLPDASGHGAPEAVETRSLATLFGDLAMGNLAALEDIYDLTAPELFRMALWCTGSRADAEDAVQSVFTKLVEIRVRVERVRDPRAYLLAMVHRASLDRRRRAARKTEPIHDSLIESDVKDPQRAVDAERATRALLDLPRAQREAIFLHHFSGLSFSEIGRVTGVPTFTAASRFRNGIRALRRLMGLPND
jgi:RNA polymerase sigma-70 factor (ECF subfamily)